MKEENKLTGRIQIKCPQNCSIESEGVFELIPVDGGRELS